CRSVISDKPSEDARRRSPLSPAPSSRRNAIRLRPTVLGESSFVKPRLRHCPPYTRENPPTRVEKPWTNQDNLLRWWARTTLTFACLEFVFRGARIATQLCYLTLLVWSGHSCPLLLKLIFVEGRIRQKQRQKQRTGVSAPHTNTSNSASLRPWAPSAPCASPSRASSAD